MDAPKIIVVHFIEIGLTISFSLHFLLLKTVDCTKDIPSGTNLNITSDLGNCTVPYVVPVVNLLWLIKSLLFETNPKNQTLILLYLFVFQGENCTSISQSFLPFISVPISGPGTPNPDLDCNSLQAGQLVKATRFYFH